MKPKEFDDLIRQKFDQNDFAYNPENWDRLAEQLDGRVKKRSIMMWWLMPLAGVAASVALAMGVAPVMQQGPSNAVVTREVKKTYIVKGGQPSQNGAAPSVAGVNPGKTNAAKRLNKHKAGLVAEQDMTDEVHINIWNAIPNSSPQKHKAFINLLDKSEMVLTKAKEKKKETVAEVAGTFKPQVIQGTPKTTIILNGGYSQGSVSNGYVAGATVRRMVSDKVFVESDLAFASSNNLQVIGSVYSYTVGVAGSRSGNQPVGSSNNLPTGGTPPVAVGPAPGTQVNGGVVPGAQTTVVNPGVQASGGSFAGARVAGGNSGNSHTNSLINTQIANGSLTRAGANTRSFANSRVSVASAVAPRAGGGNRTGAKITSTTTVTDGSSNDTKNKVVLITEPRTTTDVPYNMNYVQLSPSIGVKVAKRFSVGAGVDVQQALADRRPALDPTDNASEQQAPLLDLGFLAKTEYSLTSRVRAGVCYRKGVNNLFAPDKYTERDYLQFQIKCVIFKK